MMHKLEGFSGDLMYPQSYKSFCTCRWHSKSYGDVGEARKEWASHVFSEETKDE